MGIFDRIVGQLGDLIDQLDEPDDVRQSVERGEQLLEEGDLDGAASELSRALLRKPDHVRAGFLLGRVELLRGRPDAAERALREALAGRSDFPEAQVLLGEALAARGDEAGAAEALRRALEGGLGSTSLRGSAWRTLGRLHLDAGRADKAVRELRKAVASLPDEDEALQLLGEALAARGDLDEARLCLERAAAAFDKRRASPAPPAADGAGAAPAVEAREGSPQRAGVDGGASTPPAPALDPVARSRRARVRLSLGVVNRRLGRVPAARSALLGALEDAPSLVEVRLALADLEAGDGDREAARIHARIAVDMERSTRTLLAVARHSDGSALEVQEAYEAARSAAGSRSERAAIAREAMYHALRAAGQPGADERALAKAAARAANLALVDSVVPADGTGAGEEASGAGRSQGARDERSATADTADLLAANALALLLGPPDGAPPDLDRALRLADEAAASGRTLESLLVHARAHLARGAGEDRASAAASLHRALDLSPPDDTRARRALASLHRTAPLPRSAEGEGVDLYPLLRATHARLLQAPETSDLAPEAARIVEILDRPLLVTVMGEFNAGKSTFVNALVGEEVAPMGIVPTTATINVLKYGAERGGRVVYRDDTVRNVAWAEVGPLLRALDENEATRIRFVEVLYPLETLQRVNIVDTPGLNSIRPEHEATAREFIAQADAVIWLFSCRQPGTASEREALGKVREAHKKALGVVNQIDRLEGPEQVEEVLGFLRHNFGDLVEALVPFSAREALLGRTDPERLARSNRALLEQTLDERFFNRKKAIQRAQAVRRAETLLGEAARRAEAALQEGRGPALVEARDRGAPVRTRFDRFLVEERLALIADLDSVYAQAAREVLDFARPRSWAFGANQASPADRDFLVDLVAERLGGLAEASRRRVTAEALRAAEALSGTALPERWRGLAEEELRLLEEEVYGRYRAFIRGFLRGGRVDDFFTRVLPRIELGEQSIRRALLRDLPALDVLEDELCEPLGRFADRFLRRQLAEIDAALGADELRRLETAARLVDPVAELRAALSRFVVEGDGGMVAARGSESEGSAG